MTIARRLYLLMSLSIVSLAILGGLCLFQMGRVYDTANYGNENALPSLSVLNRMTDGFARERLHIYRHALTSDQARKEEINTAIALARKERDSAFKEYEQHFSDETDRKMFNDEIALLKAYDEGVKTALEFSNSDLKELAQQELLTQSATADKLNSAIQAHIAYNESLARRSAEQAKSTAYEATTQTIGIIVLVSLSCLIVGRTVIRSVNKPLREVIDALGRLAQGDLAFRLDAKQNDEIGQLKVALNATIDRLRETLEEIANDALMLSHSSQQLVEVSRQMASSSIRQSESTSAASASLQQLTVSIDQVSGSADEARLCANDAELSALDSSQEFVQTSRQIGLVASRVESSSKQILALSDQVQRIGNITTVIREVADQTNLLALNAAIEAARAGEQGRGFAVVADEVRKLAERTTHSVQEISSMIASIQAEAAQAVKGMESSQVVVGEVVTSAERAGTAMGGIQQATTTVQSTVSGISEALIEQRAASADLARNVESLAQMSESNSATAATVSNTATALAAVSVKLQGCVAAFRIARAASSA